MRTALLATLLLVAIPTADAQVMRPPDGPHDPLARPVPTPLVEAVGREAWHGFAETADAVGRIWTTGEGAPIDERVRLARRWAAISMRRGARAKGLFQALAWVREDRGNDRPWCADAIQAVSVLGLLNFWPLSVLDLDASAFEGPAPTTTLEEQQANVRQFVEAASALLENRAEEPVDVCPTEPSPAAPPPPPDR